MFLWVNLRVPKYNCCLVNKMSSRKPENVFVGKFESKATLSKIQLSFQIYGAVYINKQFETYTATKIFYFYNLVE
jgi:hypothetical protein